MKKYSLAQWVQENGGVENTARVLGVFPPGVRVWLRGEGCPKVRTIIKMIDLSHERLTFKSITAESTRSLSGKARLSNA